MSADTRLDRALSQARTPQVPDGLAKRIAADVTRLPQDEPAAPIAAPRRRYGVAAAAAGFVLLAGIAGLFVARGSVGTPAAHPVALAASEAKGTAPRPKDAPAPTLEKHIASPRVSPTVPDSVPAAAQEAAAPETMLARDEAPSAPVTQQAPQMAQQRSGETAGPLPGPAQSSPAYGPPAPAPTAYGIAGGPAAAPAQAPAPRKGPRGGPPPGGSSPY